MTNNRFYLPTHHLPGQSDMPVTLVTDPDSKKSHQRSQFGYYAAGENGSEYPRDWEYLDTLETIQAAGFVEVPYYRDFGDDKVFGRYTLLPTQRRKNAELICGYTVLGWLAIRATHPLIHEFSSGYVWKDYVLYLADGTKLCTTCATHGFGPTGGSGHFDDWIEAEKLEHLGHDPKETLNHTRLDILLWNTTNNQNFHTFKF